MKKLLTGALVSLAAIKIAIGYIGYAYLLTSSSWQFSAVVFTIQLTVLVGVGLLLFYNSLDDERAFLFGMVAFLVATAYTSSGLDYLIRTGRFPIIVFFDRLPLDAFFPYFFWRFISIFPRAFVPVNITNWIRRVTKFVLLVGTLLIFANILHFFEPDSALAGYFNNRDSTGLYAALTYGIPIPALLVLLYRVRNARESERRRVKVFVTGLIASLFPPVVFIVVTSVSDTARNFALNENINGYLIPLLQLFVLATPVITTYAILVERILPTRLVLKTTVAYSLGYIFVALFILSPVLLFIYYLYQARSFSILSIILGSNGIFLGLALVGSIYFFNLRKQAFLYLEKLFFRARYDVNDNLSELVKQASSASTVLDLLNYCKSIVNSTVHPNSIYTMLVSDNCYLQEPNKRLASVDLDSRLAKVLGRTKSEKIDKKQLEGLTAEEIWWITQANVEVIVPIQYQGQLRGCILLGDRKSELPYSTTDLSFLDLAANAISTHLDRVSGVLPVSDDVESAYVCDSCKTVDENFAHCSSCGSALKSMLPLPLNLYGHYLIRTVLGGGLATVYLADDLRLKRPVVLKSALLSSREELEFFRHEARVMATLNHQNVAAIYGYESFKSIPVLVCEFLPNGTLSDRISNSKVLVDEENILGIFTPLIEALGYIHRKGIVHGDIKPSNIGFDGQNVPKLLDFGLAKKQMDGAEQDIFGHRFDGGTYAYLSPERINGAELSPTADLWAMAVTIYETLFGEDLFLSDNLSQTALRIAKSAETIANSKAVESEFFLTALNPDIGARPQTANQLIKLMDTTLSSEFA